MVGTTDELVKATSDLGNSIALCMSVFLVALDNTIITTAIPKITDDFNSLDDIGWYGSGKSLHVSTCQTVLTPW